MKLSRLVLVGLLAACVLLSAGCSKTCVRCGGSGETVVTKACPRCSGTGSVREVCAKCNGRGKMEAGSICPYCNGTANLTCTYRTGIVDPGTTCYLPNRNTYGYPTIIVVCRKGMLEPLDPVDQPKMGRLLRNNPNRVCPRCGGSGQFPCSYCDGKGVLSGVLVCSACNGQGETIAKCPECKGQKTVQETEPCPVCKGKGTVHKLFG